MNSYLRMMRPHQWTKQSIVLIPVLSLGESISTVSVLLSFAAALAFTFSASFVYVVNDYFDLTEDYLDPVRKSRPLAAGIVSKFEAKILIAVFGLSGITINIYFSRNLLVTLAFLVIYIAINSIYSILRLKNQNILGIIMVATGFPLRFAFGCQFLDIQVSYWALVLLMELALFMLSVKRYQMTLRKGIESINPVSSEFWLLAAIVIVAFFSATYTAFVSDPSVQAVWGANALILSIIPIALSIVRFFEIAMQVKNWKTSDVTDSFFKDTLMIFLVLIYIVTMLFGSLIRD